MSSWELVLFEPAKTILGQIGQFVGNVLLVLIILLIGWLISKLVKAVVTKVLTAAKVDVLSDRIELDALLEKGGISYTLSEMIGVICYWLAILVTFMVAINAVGLTVASELLKTIVLFIPKVVVALFILILGMFAAVLLRNIVLTAANNAGLAQTKILGKVTEVVIMVFVVFMALEQLNIGVRITELTLSIILGSIGLGLALAFGLGCRDIAGKSVNDLIEKLKKK